MSTKKQKTFDFTYTLRRTRVAQCKYTIEMIDLQVLAEVSYTGGPAHDADSYTVEAISSIIYDGKNVWALLYMLEALEEIETEALAQGMELFTNERENAA